jgi:DNA repair exonuclease SbcCD ATPase subunit
MYLQHLSICGFRGVRKQLDIPLADRTIFYGPNGSGKSSILQAVAWTLYGKLPLFSGGVFSKEDALVNDFLDEAKAEVTVTLSNGTSIRRQRTKRHSTGAGVAPPILSLSAEDPQIAVEQLLGLNLEQFLAAVFLHQETIRDFLTTTPEKRSTTVDRMIGTYLLRTLIKLIDPRVPDKAIGEAQKALEGIDAQLVQASVLNREVILNKKAQYGDPGALPQVLTAALGKLAPALSELGLPIPEPTMEDLSSSLSAARQTQLEHVSALMKRAGELDTLSQRYEQALEMNWLPIREQKTQFGDPDGLPNLLQAVRLCLAPNCQKLSLAQPGNTLVDLENNLSAARRAQPTAISQLEQQIATLRSLQERYHQAAVANWLGVAERRAQWGDPSILPSLLAEIRDNLTPILQNLELSMPGATLPSLETSLAEARKTLPEAVGKLERRSGEFLALKDRYLQVSREVVEDLVVPPELIAQRADLQGRMNATNRSISALRYQLDDFRAKEEQAKELRLQAQTLPSLLGEIERLRGEMARLEIAGRQGTLYNQVLDVGRQYLEQIQPDHCPVCKQAISDLDLLLDTLRDETPADVEKMRQGYSELKQQLSTKQIKSSDLENKQRQLAELEVEISEFPSDLEQQISQRQAESKEAADAVAIVQAEIFRIEGRIQMIAENRQRLQDVVQEIEIKLGEVAGPDLPETLGQAASVAHQRAARLGSLDLQPIADQLSQGRQLHEIEQEEERLRQQLREVLTEVEYVLAPVPTENIPNEFEKAIQTLRDQAREIEALDFQPIADDLARARQLKQIQDEEERLHKELKAVETQVQQTLHLPPEEADLRGALDGSIREARLRAQQINDIDLQPVEVELQRAARLEEIRKDEAELHRLESNYRVANREKARLNHQIQQLTELREALLDIAETTKRHQETIIMNVLSNLDIHRYYEQLDPHPAYTDLQIEPELTSRGTYNYWIKALTSDYSHGTYVQTRFSTAQANCAAIAIFLAVNQHLSKKLETVILDDPSQSMDPDHMQRLAETLAASSRQVIVATEDPQMYDFLRSAFDMPTIYELGSWTTDGTRLA